MANNFDRAVTAGLAVLTGLGIGIGIKAAVSLARGRGISIPGNNPDFKIDTKDVKRVQKLTMMEARYLTAELFPEFDNVIADLKQMYKETFDRKGPRYGRKWKRLAKSTQAQRRDRVSTYRQSPQVQGKILWWTGRLRASLVGDWPHTTRRVQKVGRSGFELQYGSSHPLAMVHHKGATIRRPAITASGRALSLYHKDGTVSFRRSAGPTTIQIPKRQLHTRKGLEEVLGKMKFRVKRRVFEIWIRG